MMNELDRVLFAAWERVWGKIRGDLIRGDVDELNVRLARRRRPEVVRPARAFCVGVRAGDTRIEAEAERHVAEEGGEWVRMSGVLLREWNQPIRLDSFGAVAGELAKRMGVHIATMRHWIRLGLFRVRRIKRFGGTLPVVHYDGALDPLGPKGQCADLLWGHIGRTTCERVPADFVQRVRRVRRGQEGLSRNGIDLGPRNPNDETRNPNQVSRPDIGWRVLILFREIYGRSSGGSTV